MNITLNGTLICIAHQLARTYKAQKGCTYREALSYGMRMAHEIRKGYQFLEQTSRTSIDVEISLKEDANVDVRKAGILNPVKNYLSNERDLECRFVNSILELHHYVMAAMYGYTDAKWERNVNRVHYALAAAQNAYNNMLAD